jgi:hypothetical protein
MRYYYSRKFAIEKAVCSSGIKNYSILRPSFLIHNYHILGVTYPLAAVNANFDPYDVRKFAAAAFLDPKPSIGLLNELYE